MSPIDKATPRPWVFKVVPTSIGRCFKIGSEAQVNEPHGPICLYDDCTSLNPRSHEQAEADAALIVRAVNLFEAHEAVAEALKGLMDAQAKADKQWVGLNMLNAGQKRAYDILLEGKIVAEKALSALRAKDSV